MADRSGYIGRAPGDSSVVVARQTFSPTGIQTDFTFASGYVVGYLDLYLNGARLIEGQDFTATDGSVVGLTTYAQNGDVLELVAYKAFNATNVQSAGGDFSVGANLSVTGTLTVGGVEVQPGAAGTWASYDSNTGISTTKKVKVDNDFEVTGVGTFASRVSIGDSIFHVGDDNTAFGFPAADTFTVYTGGSEKLRVSGANANHILGIGTDDPQGIIHTAKPGGTYGPMAVFNSQKGDVKLRIDDLSNSSTVQRVYITHNQSRGGGGFAADDSSYGLASIAFDDGSLILGTNTSGNTTTAGRLRIDSSGNVGINTTIPTENLSVNGNVVFGHDQPAGNPGSTIGVATVRGHHVNSDADYAELYFANSTSSGGSTASIRAGRSGDNNGTNLTFYTQQFGGSAGNGTERLRIGSDGQIGLGGANYGSTGQVLTSNGASSAPTWQDASGGDSLDVTASLFI